ncbi:MAG: NUDIX domain-containing protein [Nitrospirales bacterium]|nr:NUDIX domain-containing protein [Nitrospirales bacterium]
MPTPLISAGLLMFRRDGEDIEVFLVHPGGPFFRNKDIASWTIPKGLINEGEEPLAAAMREFEEETGFVPTGGYIPLSPVTLSSGKIVHAWAFEGDADPSLIRSNTFTMEWPPRSGVIREYPEVDRAGWFDLAAAEIKITKGQLPLLREIREICR